MLKVLDLFSGIGGFSLGLERTGGFETVAFCEIEEYPRRVLAKHWPDVPCYADVRELSFERLETDGLGRIDCVVGGYPCQPFSQAGKRRGQEDDRHLWPEMYRIVASVRPRWVIAENVAGHISMGLDEVLSDLESEGYTAWPLVIPACAVDAQHRRDRVWIIAKQISDVGNTQHDGLDATKDRRNTGEKFVSGRQKQSKTTAQVKVRKSSRTGNLSSNVADSQGERLQGLRSSWQQIAHSHDWQGLPVRESERPAGTKWQAEPELGRVANGIPNRTHRIKGLGNAIVPQVAYEIFNHLEAFSQSNQDLLLRRPGGQAAEVAAHNLQKP